MKREPTAEEREKIVRTIVAGDRIGATSMYISITECGLTEAQGAHHRTTSGESRELRTETTEETSFRCSLLSCARDAPSAPVRRSMPVFPP
jgi:hypothetical protein